MFWSEHITILSRKAQYTRRLEVLILGGVAYTRINICTSLYEILLLKASQRGKVSSRPCMDLDAMLVEYLDDFKISLSAAARIAYSFPHVYRLHSRLYTPLYEYSLVRALIEISERSSANITSHLLLLSPLTLSPASTLAFIARRCRRTGFSVVVHTTCVERHFSIEIQRN